MLSMVRQAAMNNKGLQEATPMSFVGVCLTASQLGLEPNTPLGEAWMIPFRESEWNPKTREREYKRTIIQFIPGWRGLAKLAYNTGQVKPIHPSVVWQQDIDAHRFDFEFGSNQHLKHIPLHVPLNPDPDANPPVYAYAHAGLVNGGEAFIVWPWSEVLRIRNLSQGYRRAIAARDDAVAKKYRIPATYTDAPWIKWWDRMVDKTMVRALANNKLPRSIELAYATQLDSLQDRRPANFEKVIHAEFQGLNDEGFEQYGYMDAAVKAASETDEEAQNEDRNERQREGRAGSSAPAASASTSASATTKPSADTLDATFKKMFGDKLEPARSQEPTLHIELIDLFGEIVGTFDDAVLFAEALLKLWNEATDADQTAGLLEYNADGIADARTVPEAAALLDALNTPRDFTAPPPVFTPVEPPSDRGGKPDWAQWLKLCKVEIGQIEQKHVGLWAEAHRAVLSQAPSGPRIQVVRAIDMAMNGAGLARPAWLAEVAVAESKPAAAPPASVESAPPPASPAPSADPPKRDDADTIWARRTLARIAQYSNTRELREEMFATAVVRKMDRLKRERPDLFNQVNQAATVKMRAMTTAEQSASNNEPPPPEDGDPGPGA
jgi:phage RecT family recombinase